MYQPQDLAIYIHWPFCKSKCPYCDFYKEVNRNFNQGELIDNYLDSLQRYYEITSNRQIKSVFFGGGTPSLITPTNIARILDFIAKKWNIATNPEISLEANPNTETPTIFSDLKDAGINRLSLGVQSLNEDSLHFLGRTHNLATARHCLEQITKIYSNHSADLIYALPNQTPDMWLPQLQEICSYGLTHISLYQLTIEEGTVFARRGIKPLADEPAADLYSLTTDFLATYGYQKYEVSNFAKPNYQSIHNLTYWQGGDYIGIGKSAHGRLTLNGEFITTVYPFIHEKISPQERAEELVIMGLRLSDGINKKRFAEICGLELNQFVNPAKLSQLLELELLSENEQSIRATPQGMLVLNKIIEELCC